MTMTMRALRTPRRAVKLVKTCLRPRSHPGTAFELSKRVASYLVPEYWLPSPFVAWYSRPDLKEHQSRFNDSNEKMHRLFFLEEILKLVRDVSGDTAEVGVYTGSSSLVILEANSASPHEKVHFLFDSFQGLSLPGHIDGNYWREGDLAVSVQGLLLCSDDGLFKVLPGWIPDRFSEVTGNLFSFVHIDVDLFEPTYAALEFFSARMASGGIILCDDYGSTRCPGATEAADRWARGSDQTWIAMPGGGAFSIWQ